MIELIDRAKPVLLRLKLPYLRALRVRLFQNEWTPSGSDTAADYTEATFVGYAPQPLTDFGPTYLNTGQQGETDTCAHIWTQAVADPVNVIYGYYVTDPNGYVIFAERNTAGAVRMDRIGAVYSLRIAFLEDTLR